MTEEHRREIYRQLDRIIKKLSKLKKETEATNWQMIKLVELLEDCR